MTRYTVSDQMDHSGFWVITDTVSGLVAQERYRTVAVMAAMALNSGDYAVAQGLLCSDAADAMKEVAG